MGYVYSDSGFLMFLFDNTKGGLNSEWIYEVIISPKMPTKKYFCPGSLLQGRAEILVIFGWHFEWNDDLINSEFNWPLEHKNRYGK